MRMEKQSFFALTAWRLGGACVRRAAMTLAVMMLTVTAWAIGITVNVKGAGSVTVAKTRLHSEVTATATAGTPATVTTEANGNESVNLTFAPGEGYIVTSAQISYRLNNSYQLSVNDISDDGTFVMPSSSDIWLGTGVTVDITFDHILEGGVDEASAVDITDDTVTKLSGGYYTISSDITFDHTITLSGNTVLTLASGKTMTINTSEDNGIYGNDKYSLTVGGEGSMSVIAGKYAINCITDYTQTGGNVTLSAENYGLFIINSATISGGTLSANGTGDFGEGIKSNNVIISGGSVSATGTNYGIRGNYVSITGGVVIAQGYEYSDIYGYNGLSITGGQVTAVTKGISIQYNVITLGCTNATDFIKASSYVGTVKIADDQTLYGSDFPSTSFTGTIDDPSVLNGQTLRPSAAVTESGINEYTIWNAYGWDAFCDRLAADDGKTFFSGKTVKLGADITVSRMAGSSGHEFCGTFDGGIIDGGRHTLTFTATATDSHTAPFRYVQGTSAAHAVIKDLNVVTTITANGYRHQAGLISHQSGYVDVTGCNVTANISCTKTSDNDLYPSGLVSQAAADNSGTLTISHCTVGGQITTDARYAAGMVGVVQNSTSITDCACSVTISSSYSGDATDGGIVAIHYQGTTTITGCVFNGSLLGSDTNYCGGIVGYYYQGAVDIYDTLFDPTQVTMSTVGSATFIRRATASCHEGCYYTQAFGATTTNDNAQGEQAYSITAGTNVTVANAGTATEYSTSGITTYGTGIKYGEVLYAGNGETVSLTLANTLPSYYAFNGYAVSPDGTTLSEVGDHYTLTMPDADVTVTLTATPDPTHFSQSGDEYTIHTATGWDIFCDALLDNDTYNRFSGKTVKLGADITVSRMAGSSNHDFCGTFDGDHKTLTFTSTENVDGVAPFSYISETTPTGSSEVSHPAIRNLNVVVDINTSATHAGGLVGRMWGTLTIEGCTVSGTIQTSNQYAAGFIGEQNSTANITNSVSSVTINSSFSGDGYHGGFVAIQSKTSLSISIIGCVFNGSITSTGTNATALCSGFVGRRLYSYVSITNSLFAPTSTNITDSRSCTFAYPNHEDKVKITNGYYTTTLGHAQGKQAYSITADESVTVGHAGVATVYDVSGITAYKETENSSTFIAGLLYNEVLYAGAEDAVSLTLSNNVTEQLDENQYYYNVSGGATLDGTTFTMANDDVTISLVNLAPIDWATQSSGEDADHAYMIYTKEQLDLLAWRVNGTHGMTANTYQNKYFKLGADITCSHTSAWNDAKSTEDNYEAIGNNDHPFSGHFDGDGHTVSGIRIYKKDTDYQGLFGYLMDASISNVHLTDARITGRSIVGGIVGTAMYQSKVSGTTVTASKIYSAEDRLGYFFCGAICGTIYDDKNLERNYYHGCTVQGTANATGVGYYSKDVETNDGAVPMPVLSDGDNNATAITTLATRGEQGLPTTYPVILQGRTLYKDGKWNTLCLPFDVTVGNGQMEDATAMTLNSTTSGFVASTGVLTLNFDNVTTDNIITAGTPFIVKWGKSEGYDANPTDYDVTNPVFSGVTVSNTEAGSVTSTDKKVQFVGTYSPVVIYSDAHDNLYLGAANTLYWPSTEGFTLGACRAYFHVDLTMPEEGSGNVRAFVLNFGEDEATGILSTMDDTNFTDSDDAWYDLSGRKLSGKPSQRGVYIHGGRKIAIQ